ncbi:MAG TPA: hypothetical protein VIG78_08275 [Gemmatimonadaceae bacterium]|jgi:hypothetical protein
MTAPTNTSERVVRPRTSLALWFAALGGPAAGLANVIIAYATVDRACVNDSSIVLHVLAILFLVVAVGAGVVGWRLRERIGEREPTAGGLLARSHFLATVGVLTSATAFFGVLLQWIPIFFLGACHGS